MWQEWWLGNGYNSNSWLTTLSVTPVSSLPMERYDVEKKIVNWSKTINNNGDTKNDDKNETIILKHYE